MSDATPPTESRPPTPGAEGRTSKFLWAVGLSLGHQAVVLVTGLWLTRYLLSEVGAGALGWWAQATIMVGYLGLVDLGLNSLLPREVAATIGRGGDSVAELPGVIARFGKFALYQLPVAVLIGAGGVALLVQLDGSSLWLSIGVMVVAVATFPLRVASGVLTGLQDVRFVGGFRIAIYLAGVVVTVACVRAGLGLLGVVIGWAVQTVGSVALAWGRLLTRHRQIVPSPRTVAAVRVPRKMLVDGGWAWMSTLGVGLAATAELLVIGWFYPLPVVFAYACTTKLVVVVTPLVLTICLSALPGMAELRATGDTVRIRRATTAYTQLVLAASGFLGVVVLAANRGFVGWWVGDAYYLSDSTTALATLGMTVRHAGNSLGILLFCLNAERALWRVTLVDGVLTLAVTAGLLAFAPPSVGPAGPLFVSVVYTLPTLLLIVGREGTVGMREWLKLPAIWAAGYATVFAATAVVVTVRPDFSLLARGGVLTIAVVCYCGFVLWTLKGTPLRSYLSGRR